MGRALGTALRPVGRRIDDLLPGVNSKDEARRIKAKTPLRGVTPAESARVVRLPQATGDAPAKPKPPTAPVLPRATTRTTSSSPAPRPAVRTTAPKPSPASTPKPVDKVPSTAVTKAEPAAPQRAMSNADDYKKYQEAASNFLNSKTASKEGRMAAAELKKRRLAIGK
jgi:translation initiation factor IF-2